MSNSRTRMACTKPEKKKRSTTQMATDETKSSGNNDMHASTFQPDIFEGGAGPELSKEIQDRIGTQLRLLYDQVVNENVPQSLLELVKRLEAKK